MQISRILLEKNCPKGMNFVLQSHSTTFTEIVEFDHVEKNEDPNEDKIVFIDQQGKKIILNGDGSYLESGICSIWPPGGCWEEWSPVQIPYEGYISAEECRKLSSNKWAKVFYDLEVAARQGKRQYVYGDDRYNHGTTCSKMPEELETLLNKLGFKVITKKGHDWEEDRFGDVTREWDTYYVVIEW